MAVKSSFTSADLNAIAEIINPRFNNPFKGEIKLDSQLEYSSSSRWKGYIDLSAERFSAWGVFLSQVQMKGTIQDQVVFFEKLHIYNSNKWNINLKKSKVHLKKPYRFETKMSVNNSQLSELLKNISCREKYLSVLM